MNEHEILENSGKISHEMTMDKVMEEHDKFRVIQDIKFISDFDKLEKLIKLY